VENERGMEYKFIVGCNKKFESDDVVNEISTNSSVQALTAQAALNCGDKFDGGNGVQLYLCDACLFEARRDGSIW